MRRGDQLQKNTGGRWFEIIGTYREAKYQIQRLLQSQPSLSQQNQSQSEQIQGAEMSNMSINFQVRDKANRIERDDIFLQVPLSSNSQSSTPNSTKGYEERKCARNMLCSFQALFTLAKPLSKSPVVFKLLNRVLNIIVVFFKLTLSRYRLGISSEPAYCSGITTPKANATCLSQMFWLQMFLGSNY